MTTDHAQIFTDILRDEGYSNVFASDLTEISSDKCIGIVQTQGFKPRTYLDGGSNSVFRDGVKVICRGSQRDMKEVRARTQDVREDLHARSPEAANWTNLDTDYVSIRARGGPRYAGRDSDSRPRFILQFIAKIDE